LIPYQYENHIKQLFAKYGKVFTINIYGTDVVMISDADLLKRCFVNDVFNYRPKDWMFTLTDKPSLTSWNGLEWKEQRKFALRMFKEVGMGARPVEDLIHGEIDYLFKEIKKEQESKQHGKADIEKLVGSSASNVVNIILAGERFDFDHPTRKVVDKIFLGKDDLEMGRTLGMFNYLTIVPKIIFIFTTGLQREMLENFEHIKKYIRDKVEFYRNTYDPESQEPTNFIQAYQREMRNITSKDTFFDDDHLYSNVMAFYAAGNGTTKHAIGWCLQALVVHPQVQEKMRSELDSVVGRERKVSMQDKASLPYCESFFAEVERVSSGVPLSLIHVVAEDTELMTQRSRYTLPKGTHIIPCTFAIHSDPEYFPDPETFIPERFLSPDGKKFVRNGNLMNFGTGKRSCPGEPLAKTEIFLYVTSFIQKFILSTPEGFIPTLEARIDTLHRVPKDGLHIMFTERK
jgi:cytochrome P450